MIPNKPINKALILGLGAGTIARLLLEKNPECQILGVDNSLEVIQASKDYLALDRLKVDLRIADAFEFIHEIEEKFDLIIVDLFIGPLFPLKILTPKFLKRCHQLLMSGGILSLNTPNLDHGLTLQLPTRVKLDIGANVIYSIVKDYDIINQRLNLKKETSTS